MKVERKENHEQGLFMAQIQSFFPFLVFYLIYVYFFYIYISISVGSRVFIVGMYVHWELCTIDVGQILTVEDNLIYSSMPVLLWL